MSQSTSQFKQGGYIRCENSFNLILVKAAGSVLLSYQWSDPSRREEMERLTSGYWTTESMLEERGYTPCTPQEAGVPEEKWVPEVGKKYFSGRVNCEGKADFDGNYWRADSIDNMYRSIGNVHKDSESAIAWAKKRYNIS